MNKRSFIDYLSWTFKPGHASAYEYQGTELKLAEGDKAIPKEQAQAAFWIASKLSKLIKFLEVEERDGGMFGYRKSFVLKREGVQAGIIAYGGNAGTVYVSLSGFGCYGVDMQALYKLICILPSIRITRVDIAHDDLNGFRDIAFARAQYEAGGFTVRGSAPKARYFSDEGSGEGCTFYVGKRENGKQLRVYEKGKQLGDKESPWVRWELELHNVDREIPLDVLLRPDHYLCGAYPVMAFLETVQEAIATVKKTVEISLDHLKKYCKVAYGRLLYVLRGIGYDDAEILSELTVKGTPRRLMAPFGAASIVLSTT